MANKRKGFKKIDTSSINVYESDVSDDSEVDLDSDNSINLDEDETDPSASEEEVLGIYSTSDEEDDVEIGDDDDDFEINKNANDKDDNLVGSKAWGKKKKHFYQTNSTTKSNSFKNEDEEEAAKMEEQEALTIQKRLAAEIDNVDLALDLFPDTIKDDQEQQPVKDKEIIEIDLARLSENEKTALLKKECPEMLIYIKDFKKYMTRINDKLRPLLSMKASKLKFKNSDFWYFIQSVYETNMAYCTNIIFYILYKLRRNASKFHPIMNRLSEYKSVAEKLDSIYVNSFELLVNTILSGEVCAKEIPKSNIICGNILDDIGLQRLVQLREKMDTSDDENKDYEIEDNSVDMKSSDDDNDMKEEADDEGNAKRGINYQIAKNKGLTPRRKKECRNPRVKLRNKYRKAKIRRKGQIREPRKELRSYSGEISGINPNVCRSVSLKF